MLLLVQDIPFCVHSTLTKQTICVLRLTQLYNIVLLYWYWLLVSTSMDHHQDNIYKKIRITNKLTVHMCTVKNTTIFLIVRLLLIRYNYMFRPSMLAIFRLYMKHLTISYIYTWASLQFVGWGGCEISFSVCRRGVDRDCLGGVVEIPFMSLNNYIYR